MFLVKLTAGVIYLGYLMLVFLAYQMLSTQNAGWGLTAAALVMAFGPAIIVAMAGEAIKQLRAQALRAKRRTADLERYEVQG